MCVVWTGDGEKVSWMIVCVRQYNRSGGRSRQLLDGREGHTATPSYLALLVVSLTIIHLSFKLHLSASKMLTGKNGEHTVCRYLKKFNSNTHFLV